MAQAHAECAAQQRADEPHPNLSQLVCQHGGSSRTESDSSGLTLAPFDAPASVSTACGPHGSSNVSSGASSLSSTVQQGGRLFAAQALPVRRSSSPWRPLSPSKTTSATAEAPSVVRFASESSAQIAMSPALVAATAVAESSPVRRPPSEQQPSSARRACSPKPAATQSSATQGLALSAGAAAATPEAPPAFFVLTPGSVRVRGSPAAAPGRDGRPRSAAGTPRLAGSGRDTPARLAAAHGTPPVYRSTSYASGA